MGKHMGEPSIRLYVVDDDVNGVHGLPVRLKKEGVDDIAVLDATGDPERDIAEVYRLKPDVVLMDYQFSTSLRLLDGISAFTAIQAQWPVVKALLYTTQAIPGILGRAKKSGMKGYVDKDTSIQELAQHVRSVHRNLRVWNHVDTAPHLALEDVLSRAELDVALLSHHGLYPQEISSRRGTAEKTVLSQLEKCYLRLGIRKSDASGKVRKPAAQLHRQMERWLRESGSDARGIQRKVLVAFGLRNMERPRLSE